MARPIAIPIGGPMGIPLGHLMGMRWVPNGLPNSPVSSKHLDAYVGAPTYVCFGASVVITESEIVNYLPRATTTLGIGGKR